MDNYYLASNSNYNRKNKKLIKLINHIYTEKLIVYNIQQKTNYSIFAA